MMLLFALLFAAPERVVVVAKPPEKPGVFAKISSAIGSAARRLYEKTDPDVDEGNALAAQNDAEGALKAYDRALARLPDAPELRFDRANALLKLGSESAAEAAREAAFALEHGNASLKPRAAFDLGLADEAMGRPDDAVKAYQQTLALDPDDVDAKVNLELLLRSQEERKQKQQVGQDQKEKVTRDRHEDEGDRERLVLRVHRTTLRPGRQGPPREGREDASPQGRHQQPVRNELAREGRGR